ncbi:unnamed protein product [Linum tenue]|uniref:Uncharacterized protein n=1 Tax=Linum tenue TaxID=586396 RepID=A0AAV0J9G6_9ROSI|nr:unnamed protein product [Linum tenue]
MFTVLLIIQSAGISPQKLELCNCKSFSFPVTESPAAVSQIFRATADLQP